MGVLPKLSHPGLKAILSVLLLLSSGFACWSQLLQPMSAEQCCAKGRCNGVPGQPVHSSCRIAPPSTERIAPPVMTTVPVPQLTHVLVDVRQDQRFGRLLPALRIVDHSPPPLFLANSSFLI